MIEGLRKSFGGQPVLRGLDLEIPTGSITVIIGRSGGASPSSSSNLIGLLRPDGGRVLLDGQEITRLSGEALDAIRRRYGVVFQGGALFRLDALWRQRRLPPAREGEAAQGRDHQSAWNRRWRRSGSRREPEVPGRGVGRHAQARGHRARPRDRAEIVFFDERPRGSILSWSTRSTI